MRDLRAHRRLRPAVGAFVDGELSREAAAEMAHHLSGCWECSMLAETVRLLKRALQGRREDPPALVRFRLRRFAEDLAAGDEYDNQTPLRAGRKRRHDRGVMES